MKKLKLKAMTACSILLILSLAVPFVSFAAVGSDEEMPVSAKYVMSTVFIDDPPAPPQDFQAYKTAERKVTLRWRGLIAVSGYEVYIKKDDGKFHLVKEVKSRSSRKYTVKGLSPNKKYKLAMRSYKILDGEKKYSRYVTATVDMKKQPLPKDLSVAKSLIVKVGQEKKIAVKSRRGRGSKYIKGISCKIRNKEVANASPTGVIVGKKAGRTTATIKVTLKSGLSKTFRMRINVVQ